MGKKLSIRGKDLRLIGYPEGPVISVAIQTLEKHYKRETTDTALTIAKNVLLAPAAFVNDECWEK